MEIGQAVFKKSGMAGMEDRMIGMGLDGPQIRTTNSLPQKAWLKDTGARLEGTGYPDRLLVAFWQLEIPVEDFKLPGCAGFRRSFQGIPELLVRAGIETIDELNRFNGMTDSELLAIKGIGPRALTDIRQLAANLAGNPYHSWEGSPWWQGMPSDSYCRVHGIRLVYSWSKGVYFGLPDTSSSYARFDQGMAGLLPNRNVPTWGGECSGTDLPPTITEICMSCDNQWGEWSELFHLGVKSGLWEKIHESEEAQTTGSQIGAA